MSWPRLGEASRFTRRGKKGQRNGSCFFFLCFGQKGSSLTRLRPFCSATHGGRDMQLALGQRDEEV